MSVPHFHPLTIQRVTPEAAGAVALSFAIPPELRDLYAFTPGQFLTLKAQINGEPVRRSYSICSSTQNLAETHEMEVGIKPVDGGVFSNWATRLQAGDTLDVMPPEGRFTPRLSGAVHRVGWAAGSGITPLLSIIASTLAGEADATFTLVYCNQRSSSILFNEALQDLKDRYPARLSLIHLLSRQAQEVALFNGRLDTAKVSELLAGLIPADSIGETFICGPEAMIEGCEQALLAAGVPRERIHSERFTTASPPTSGVTRSCRLRPPSVSGQSSSPIARPIGVANSPTNSAAPAPSPAINTSSCKKAALIAKRPVHSDTFYQKSPSPKALSPAR